MNAVGKMLVVLQLCLSLLFVCFAGATYSLQDSWRQQSVTANSELATRTASLADAEADKNSKVGEAERLMLEAQTAQGVTEVTLKDAQQSAAEADRLLAEVRQSRDKAIAESMRSAAEADSRLAEAVALRQEIEVRGKRLVQYLASIRDKDSQLVDLNKLLKNYEQTEERHVESEVQMTALLRFHGIDPNERVAGTVPDLVGKVDGYVVERRQSRSRSQEFAKITIGSDDKIEEGMILAVFRHDNYVCDIEVWEVSPDYSVGFVVDSSRRSNIQEGDRVTTKL